jgi:hypothetical protein
MKEMIACFLLFCLPALSFAGVGIVNNTDKPLTFGTINACSAKIPYPHGIIPPHYSVYYGVIFDSTCYVGASVDFYTTRDCSGPRAAKVTFGMTREAKCKIVSSVAYEPYTINTSGSDVLMIGINQ